MVMMNPDICEWQKQKNYSDRWGKNVLKNVIAVYEISQNEYYNCFYLSKVYFR